MNEEVHKELKKIFNGRFSTSQSTRANYARGEDTFDPVLSKGVVFPETNDEVSKILKICNEYSVPVVPFGTGTSLEGNVVGNDQGITISLEKVLKIFDKLGGNYLFFDANSLDERFLPICFSVECC